MKRSAYTSDCVRMSELKGSVICACIDRSLSLQWNC